MRRRRRDAAVRRPLPRPSIPTSGPPGSRRTSASAKLFKRSPQRVWHDLGRRRARRDSLELSIDEDGALAARWTESRATIRLPAGMEAVTLRLPRRLRPDGTRRRRGAPRLRGAELRFAAFRRSDLPSRDRRVRRHRRRSARRHVDARRGPERDGGHGAGLRGSSGRSTPSRCAVASSRAASRRLLRGGYEDLRDAFCGGPLRHARLRRHYKHYGAAEKRLGVPHAGAAPAAPQEGRRRGASTTGLLLTAAWR